MRLRISDHAVLRYLARTGAVDVEAIRAELGRRAHRCAAAASSIGVTGVFVIHVDGVRLVVDGSSETVVTTAPGRRRQGGAHDR